MGMRGPNIHGAPYRVVVDKDGVVHFMNLAPKGDMPGLTSCGINFFHHNRGFLNAILKRADVNENVTCLECLAEI